MGGFLISFVGQGLVLVAVAVAGLPPPFPLANPPTNAPPYYWLVFCFSLLIILTGVGWCATDIQQSWRLLKQRGHGTDAATFLLGFAGLCVNLLPFLWVRTAIH